MMRTALFVVIFLAAAIPTGAIPLVPQDNLGYPVHITDVTGEDRGSGFYLRAKTEDLFLVTAKHVLFTPTNELKNKSALILESIPTDNSSHKPQPDEWIRITLQLIQLVSDGQVKFHPKRDIALIKLQNANGSAPTGVRWSRSRIGVSMVLVPIRFLKPFANVNVGDDAIVYGYPTTIGLKNIPQIDKSKPLVRKGNIAWKYSQTQTIVIAAPSYPGNSGGPVVELEYIDIGHISFEIIGVISEYVPFTRMTMARNPQSNVYVKDVDRVVLENSGYTIVTPSDAILEVLEQF